MEKFPKKSWRTKLALAVTAGILAAGYVPQTFAASYSGNNNTIWGMQSEDSKTFGSNMSVAADGSLVFDFGEAVTFENSNVASPKSLVKNGNVPGAVVIKSDFTGIMHSKDYSAMAIQAGWLEGNFDEAVDKRGSVTFDGNVTLRDKNVKGEWGVTSGDLHGGFLTYKGARWQPVGIRAGLCGDVIINGNLDMAVKGSALVTDPYYKALKTTGSKELICTTNTGCPVLVVHIKYADDFKTSTITTNGDVNIETPEDDTEAFYSIANYGGTINVNADTTAARDKTVVIKGNVLTMRDGDGRGEPYFYRTGQTNIGLTNDKSSWTGVVDNTGIKQTGEVNLWLQNNAVWNHKSLSLTNGISLGELPALSAPQYDKYDGITHINKLSGGSSEANAGLIFQDNKANIDINNYSGHTTVFYKHDNDGSASADYTAGDVIIRNAEKDSAINMVTDSSKIDTKDSAKLNSVLNALAGKLTYADYANNPENLLGTVKIAGGLTNDSVTIKSGKIQFADNGKGSYSKPAATKFTTTLTGDADADEEYAKADIIQGDGSYKFANDSSITAVNGIDTAKDLKIDAAGKTLTVTTAGTDSAAIKIFNNGGSKLELTADKLVINSSADYAGKNAGIMAGDWNTTKKNVTVNGAVDITATNTVGNNNYVYGVLASNADVTVNGNLKADIDGGRGGYDHTSDSAVMAQGSSYRKTSSTVTVNGDVDITANGNGLHTNGNGSVITVNGGGAITVNDSSTKGGYAALRAGNGTINMNVALANGKATGGLGHDVAIKGNLAAIKAGDTTASVINVALDTDKSALEGVTYMTGGNGQINMWLQNGASWNNEVHGSTEKDWKGNSLFNGSQVTSFAGGATTAAAGNIYQKDSNALTIDNYSGNTNIFYEHTGDGVTFNAGDTIIKHAEKDSVVNLITSSKGLSINAETINDTLSALAGKLTYTNYKDGERNLDGKVKIAGGLTSDSLTVAAGDILFGSADGKGTGVTNLNVQAPDHQVATSFNSTLTGDTEADLEYVLGGAVKDGSYKFTENTTINVNGKDARGMDFADGTVVDASGKTLNINVTDGTRLNAGISQITNADSHVKANKIVIKLDSKDASGTTHAIHQDKGNLTIDGDVDIDITGQRHTVGVYSHAGSTTINGNVKVVLDGNHGGFAEYGAAGIYAHANYGGAAGGTVNVNGNVDISGVGNGLFANIGGGTINVNGGKINIVDDNTETGYSAIYSTCGAINMNTVKDEKGNVIGAGNNKVDITGNVVVSVGAVNYVDCYEYSLVNLGLTTKDSQLTGVIYNEFPEGGKTASQGGNKKLFTGEANLWLQNGATWTNEQQGTLANVYQGEKFTGSHVAKLTGGATAEAAGNIYQKESGALTIDNYSGNTNIFYEHAGDGVTFNAGDTVIRHAEKGSAVNLITSNKGLSINAETINDTLNALAGKLTYANYAKGERNLDGKVKIAGGLTSDSVTMAVGDILFNEADGKGSGAQHITVPSAPENQVSTSFNTTLTGDKDKNLEYVLGGVIKDGSYKFTEATSINVSGEGAKGMNFVKGTAVDATGKTLTINVTDASKGNAGIAQDVDANSTVKADKLVIKLDSTKSGQGAQGIRQTKGNLTIDANVDIDVKGDNSTMGIYSHAGSTTVNGDVKVVLDGKRGGFNEYGAAGIYAHAGYGGAVGGTVNVNGNVDISGVGNGLFANIGGATINVNGGKINIVDTDKKNGYSAIYAANGKINVNTVKDADGKVTGAGNNKVDITGNIVTSVGAVNYVDCSTETEVNVGLTTKDSKLTGVVYNQFPEGGKTVSQKGDSKTFTGATNLWLQNGATWTNEQQGVLPSVWGGEQFKGSRVNKLAGGATAEAAGNIYQNDSNSLTIDNYSGVTNIIYAHGGDGTSYAAGDTVIKHAEAGSVVNMITSNQGVTDISAALNALAGKLTYLNYATANGSERNLNGYVKLAGGLTSDSVTMVTGDIRFSEETGKGSGTDNIKFADEPDNQTAKTFNSTLTGERLKDLEYVMGGVVKDGTYKFTENTAINVSGEGAKGMNFVKDTAVDASGKTLSVNVTEASKGNAGISQDVDVNSTIKADKLVIKLDSEKSGKGAQAIRQDKGNLTIDANVDIDVKGDNSTMGIYSHAGSTTVNGDVKVVLDGKRGGFNEYGAAGIYAHAGYGGAVGGTVNVNGNVDISGVGNGLFANIGGATINVNGGKINIVDTDKKNGYSAIYATCGAINMNTVKDAAGKVIGAGNNKVDITGNVVVSVGAVNYVDCCTETEVNLGLTTKDSKLTGVVYNQFPEGGKTVSQRGDSKTFTGAANLWLQNGALWTNEQQGELPSVWGGEQFKGSYVTNLVGGTNADNAGQIYQKDSNNLTIDTLSGSIRVIYDHEFEDAETRAAGDKKIVYKAGDTVINNAKDGSQVIMATGSNGINTFDKDSVEDAFKGLANKLIYKDAEKNPGNLKAELQLGGGLTGSNVSWSGEIEWDGNNGSYKLDSAEQSIKLLYDEDAVSKDTRAAIMSGMVGWRNAATDTYRARAGAYGEDNQGVWARTWGGQNKYTGNNTSFKNSYWAGQVGYDKTLANGWNVGVAFDYMTGDDSYYAGSGDTKTYTLGLYGSKEISNNEFIDLTAKVGRVSNDFETKDILGRTVKGDYKANGFSFSGQYSKRFGSEAAGYFEPQAQLTIGRLGSCDFDSTGTLEGHISQDAFTSIVGRLGIEAGQASDHGRYFARLSLSHEFAGNVDTHFSDSSASMTREFNLDGTWCDLTVGGTYDLSDKVSFYGDVTKTLTGDYKQDWKVNAGLRFTF
ncbi:autotransporter domain-containing protein [Phascolarctobacterium succinatutens]|uniref:autotransporter domain-containing protein n=2 Tax=Phascolarctobacterium succinatutens TaxID=626940 RepID=UPI003AAF6032